MTNSLGRLRFPTALAFEPVQSCNARCFCCPYTWLAQEGQYRGQVMSRSRIKELLNDFGGRPRNSGYQGLLTVHPFRFSDPLLCQDLDLVFELADVHKFNVVMTTNGVALTQRNLELLNAYPHRMSKISVSLIGSNAQEIRQSMGLDFNKVLGNLDVLVEHYPALRPLVRVTLRIVSELPKERETLELLMKRLRSKGIAVKLIHENWMTNRIDASKFAEGQRPNPLSATPQTKERFVVGCGWANQLFQRMEVMVDGSVVLCCDDAEKHKTFGNVFEEGIKEIWMDPLRAEHATIAQQAYSERKDGLICGSCVRTLWSDESQTVADWQHHSTELGAHPGGASNEAYRLRMENMMLHRTIHDQTVRLRPPATPQKSV